MACDDHDHDPTMIQAHIKRVKGKIGRTFFFKSSSSRVPAPNLLLSILVCLAVIATLVVPSFASLDKWLVRKTDVVAPSSVGPIAVGAVAAGTAAVGTVLAVAAAITGNPSRRLSADEVARRLDKAHRRIAPGVTFPGTLKPFRTVCNVCDNSFDSIIVGKRVFRNCTACLKEWGDKMKHGETSAVHTWRTLQQHPEFASRINKHLVGRISISNRGQVKLTDAAKAQGFTISIFDDRGASGNYPSVVLWDADGKSLSCASIHLLVFWTFVPNADKNRIDSHLNTGSGKRAAIDHIDRDGFNNRVENLRLVDDTFNNLNRARYDFGLLPPGTKAPSANSIAYDFHPDVPQPDMPDKGFIRFPNRREAAKALFKGSKRFINRREHLDELSVPNHASKTRTTYSNRCYVLNNGKQVFGTISYAPTASFEPGEEYVLVTLDILVDCLRAEPGEDDRKFRRLARAAVGLNTTAWVSSLGNFMTELGDGTPRSFGGKQTALDANQRHNVGFQVVDRDGDVHSVSVVAPRIVARAFVPRTGSVADVPFEYLDVDHRDNNCHNNEASNLKWMTGLANKTKQAEAMRAAKRQRTE
ncbi:hypothetical protein DFJ74DRAFT_759627 [Hyaloraphidium curvatum]|nr:hypothetical protein DFJ74DRAFT_759627 [Hyaloraphidium curvatum]